MKTIKFFLPENLKDCDSINCEQCYLSQSQTTFNWPPFSRTCLLWMKIIKNDLIKRNSLNNK